MQSFSFLFFFKSFSASKQYCQLLTWYIMEVMNIHRTNMPDGTQTSPQGGVFRKAFMSVTALHFLLPLLSGVINGKSVNGEFKAGWFILAFGFLLPFLVFNHYSFHFLEELHNCKAQNNGSCKMNSLNFDLLVLQVTEHILTHISLSRTSLQMQSPGT